MAHEHWQLFLDESGSFLVRDGKTWQQGPPPFMVGGVLLQHANDPLFVAALETGLKQCFPGVPYPPHATDLNQLSSMAVAAYRSGDGAGPHHQAARSAIQALLDSADGSLAHFQRDVLAGTWPSYEDLRFASRWLELHSPREASSCRAAREWQRARLRNLLSAVSGFFAPPFLVLAAQTPGLAREPVPHSSYLGVLECLLERLRGALLARPGTAARMLTVHAASLRVEVAPGKVRMLRDTDLDKLKRSSGALAEAAQARSGLDGIEVRFSEPEPFDSLVHPGIVLADFACNWLHRPVFGCLPLAHLSSLARNQLCMSSSVPLAGGSTMVPLPSATGPARAHVLSLVRGDTVPPAFPLPRGWVRDQAELWATALSGGGQP